MRETARYYGYNVSQCENCIHCTNWGTMDGKKWKCKAFPDEIPSDIVMGKTSHEENVEGDNGIFYEARQYKDARGAYHYTFDNMIVDDEV